MPNPEVEIAWRAREAAGTNPAWTQQALDADIYAALADINQMDTRHRSAYFLDGLEVDRMQREPEGTPVSEVWPRSNLAINDYGQPYGGLNDRSFLMVGAGPGNVFLSSYLTLRGARPENITFVDPSADFGGQWLNPNVRAGGFNNPSPLDFGHRRHSLGLQNRDGLRMLRFIQSVAVDYLDGSPLLHSRVESLTRDSKQGLWIGKTASGRVVEADYVVLANGTEIPRSINSHRIQSNLDEAVVTANPESLIVEREQRELSVAELESGRPIVFIGLGNSTAAMINQIHKYEDSSNSGKTIEYVILTDKSGGQVRSPDRGHGGQKSIFRKPDLGYLTGFSGDLSRDRENYFRALVSGNIVYEVRSAVFDQEKNELVIESYEGTRRIKCPHVFALVGNRRNDSLLRQIDAFGPNPASPWHEPSEPRIRATDGAVSTGLARFNSGVFTIGAASKTPGNPNLQVIPGIFGRIPHTSLTLGVREVMRRPLPLSRPGQLDAFVREALDSIRLPRFSDRSPGRTGLDNSLIQGIGRERIYKIIQPEPELHRSVEIDLGSYLNEPKEKEQR